MHITARATRIHYIIDEIASSVKNYDDNDDK